MAKFSMTGCSVGTADVLFRVGAESKLRGYMACKACGAHSEIYSGASVVCSKCGSTDADKISVQDGPPEWFCCDRPKAPSKEGGAA